MEQHRNPKNQVEDAENLKSKQRINYVLMKKLLIPILLVCFTLFAFVPYYYHASLQVDYYKPYCVDGDAWLGDGKDCSGGVYTLDGSNQIGKSHEQQTKGHRWDNRFCRTVGYQSKSSGQDL
jgi:hypothetical protein